MSSAEGSEKEEEEEEESTSEERKGTNKNILPSPSSSEALISASEVEAKGQKAKETEKKAAFSPKGNFPLDANTARRGKHWQGEEGERMEEGENHIMRVFAAPFPLSILVLVLVLVVDVVVVVVEISPEEKMSI